MAIRTVSYIVREMKIVRRLLVALATVALFFGCTIGCRSEAPRSSAQTSGPRIGLSYGNTLPGMTDEKLAEALNNAVDIGASWIRVDLSWADIQPSSPDDYEWEQFDRIATQAHHRGLEVLPILTYTPEWARVSGCFTFTCAPADASQFATFAGTAAARYAQGGIHTWEIWNEENSTGFWQPKPDPALYTRLLQASSEAIRKADPQAFVVMGGLATLRTENGNLSVADFLSQPSESPLRFVDALAVHPYTYPYRASRLGPWASPWLPGNSGLPYLRQVLAESGYPNLPIWITEYGAPTGGPGPVWDGSPDSLSAGPDHVSESEQAAIAADAIATAASDPIIGALFWYTDRDFAAPLDNSESYYGIRRADGSRKPAFTALREAVQKLAE